LLLIDLNLQKNSILDLSKDKFHNISRENLPISQIDIPTPSSSATCNRMSNDYEHINFQDPNENNELLTANVG
jgi:hypothetical protein